MKIDISEMAPHIIEQLSDEELGKVDVKGISYANEQQIEALGERVTLLPKDVKLVLTDETNRSLLTQQQKHLLGLQVQEAIYSMTVQETNHNRPSVTQEVNQEIVHEPRNQMAIDDPFIDEINQYVEDAKDKPYAVFVGMSGNGKTCMLDLLVRTLQEGVGVAAIRRAPTEVNTLVPVKINDKDSQLLDTAGENFQAWFEYVIGDNNNLEFELAFSHLPLKNRGNKMVTQDQNEAFGSLLRNASKLYICTPAKHYNIETNIRTATNFLYDALNLEDKKPELIFLFNHVDSLIYNDCQNQLPSLSKLFHNYSMKLNNLNQLILHLSNKLDENIKFNDFKGLLKRKGFSIHVFLNTTFIPLKGKVASVYTLTTPSEYKINQDFIDNILGIYTSNIKKEIRKEFEKKFVDNDLNTTFDPQQYTTFMEDKILPLLMDPNFQITQNIDAGILKPTRLTVRNLAGGREVSVKYCYLLYFPHYLDHYKLLESDNLGFSSYRGQLANILMNIQPPLDLSYLYTERFKEIFSLNEFLTFDGRMMATITRNSQEIKQSVLKDKFTIQYIISSILIALIMGVVSYFFIFDYQQIKENVPEHKIAYMIGVDESKPNPFIALEEKALENLYVHFIENDPKKNTRSACMKTLNTTNSQETNSQAKAQTHNKENKSTQNKAKCSSTELQNILRSLNHLVTLHKQNQPWQETEINALLQLLSVSTKIDQVDFKKEQLLLEAWSTRKLTGQNAKVFALTGEELGLMQDYLPNDIPSGIWYNKKVNNCPNDTREGRLLCNAFKTTFTSHGKELGAIRPNDIKPVNMKSFCLKNTMYCETKRNLMSAIWIGLAILVISIIFIIWRKTNIKLDE